VLLWVAVVFIVLQLSSAAHAAKRVALVIGNSAYRYAGELANPKNDATDISAALKAHGFQVIDGFDLNKVALDRKLRDFAGALEGAEVGLFFYAGHGLQVSGQNYIVPVDAELATAAALDFETVRLDLVQRTMERTAATNILFIDACRNNPLTRNLQRAMGSRSAEIGRGLAPLEAGFGTLISFSTQPGNVALDGTGRNSPFAGALVRHLSSSNEEIMALLVDVRVDVMRETNRRQIPWEHTALTGRFYFKPEVVRPTPAPPKNASAAERSQAALDQAKAALERMDFDRAITTFNEALRLDPKNALAFHYRGSTFYFMKDLDRAIADYSQAIRLEPRSAITFNMRGLAYVGRNDFDKAIADYDEAIRLEPLSATGFGNRGIAYFHKSDFDRAIADFDEAIKLDPNRDEAFYYRGLAKKQKMDRSGDADILKAKLLNPNARQRPLAIQRPLLKPPVKPSERMLIR
jgi:tetratricopeptide (TPR) repeat protein